MHDPRKRAFELVLPRDEAGEALARLTAEVPRGRLTLGQDVIDLDDWTSLKVSCKLVGPSCLIKVRLKGATGDETLAAGEISEAAGGTPREPGGRGRYKGLKKRMKQTFKVIVAAIAAGQAPDPAIVASFVADSRLMTSYSGKGDEYYPAYDAEVSRLEAAAAAGELGAMSRSTAELARMKKECHSRHA
jgi:XXXCH domain-containing protein